MLCVVNIKYSSSLYHCKSKEAWATCKFLSLNFSVHRSTVLCSIHHDDFRFTSILSILVPSMTSAMRCSCNFLCNSNVLPTVFRFNNNCSWTNITVQIMLFNELLSQFKIKLFQGNLFFSYLIFWIIVWDFAFLIFLVMLNSALWSTFYYLSSWYPRQNIFSIDIYCPLKR